MKYDFILNTSGNFEIFDKNAFDENIGKKIDVTPETEGTIVGVKVAEDGKTATFTVEVPDDSDAAKILQMYRRREQEGFKFNGNDAT